jgi:signal transduction histidine kinase
VEDLVVAVLEIGIITLAAAAAVDTLVVEADTIMEMVVVEVLIIQAQTSLTPQAQEKTTVKLSSQLINIESNKACLVDFYHRFVLFFVTILGPL